MIFLEPELDFFCIGSRVDMYTSRRGSSFLDSSSYCRFYDCSIWDSMLLHVGVIVGRELARRVMVAAFVY